MSPEKLLAVALARIKEGDDLFDSGLCGLVEQALEALDEVGNDDELNCVYYDTWCDWLRDWRGTNDRLPRHSFLGGTGGEWTDLRRKCLRDAKAAFPQEGAR